MTQDTSRYLRLPQAAAYLGQTERFMRRLVSERRVAFYHIGRFVSFKVTDLEAFAESGRVDAITGGFHG